MCYYSDVTIDFYNETWPRARKEHRCYECRQAINKGEYYRRVFGKWEGEIDTFVTCDRCLDLTERVKAKELAEGCPIDAATPLFGDLYEAARDHGLISIWSREGK